MEIFSNIYHNFYTVCSLIPVVFNLTLAIIFYTIPNKSKATKHIMLSYLFMSLFFLGYFIAAVFYHPLAAYHRWLTVAVIFPSEIHFMLFLLYFSDISKKVIKGYMITLYSIAAVLVAGFFYVSLNSGKIFHFAGHYWDFNADAYSRIFGVVVIIYMLVFLFTGLGCFFKNKTKDRWAILIITNVMFIAIIIPGVANTLSRDGALDRGTYQITQDLFNVIGFFVAAVVYINATKDRTNFMTKILGISFATLLIVFQGLSYFSLQDLDQAYDSLAKKDVSIILDSNKKTKNLEYLVTFRPQDNNFSFNYKKQDSVADLYFYGQRIAFHNTLLYANIAALDSNNFAKKLKGILKRAPKESSGFVNYINERSLTLRDSEKNPSKKVLQSVDDIESKITVAFNKIKKLPNKNFKTAATKFLSKKNKNLKHFYQGALNYITISHLKGKKLKDKTLEYFSPMIKAGTRIYRNDPRDNHHYVSYMQVNLSKQMVYEGGFSYLSYRTYLHPTSLKLIIMLAGIMIVIFVGFQFFFHGAFIVPIKSLLEAMYKVKDGNLNVKVDIKVEDELGYITRNFNTMIETISGARKKLDDYAQNLEFKVEERTEELKAAMEEMAAINDQLVQTRDALWGEMELAKKIQTVLLPENPSINGYDIAAFMKPADEVGGDYYDVIQEGDRDWIVIGDVSGHGVPAGLVMMMVQTSMHSVLSTNPHMEPSELLRLVNKTIASNIKRLGENKYMTMTVLLRDKNNTFYFSGLHQDILIYRKESGTVEELETKGMWLGVMDDLTGTLENDTFVMKPGDMMVLYTDGITEATQGNEMFGEDRLRKMVEKYGKKTPEDLKKNLLTELRKYKRDDDITALILKKE